MELILIPKDVGRVIVLKKVKYYFRIKALPFDYGTLFVWFDNGSLREYPAYHI